MDFKMISNHFILLLFCNLQSLESKLLFVFCHEIKLFFQCILKQEKYLLNEIKLSNVELYINVFIERNKKRNIL
jgi:hypothetical protein